MMVISNIYFYSGCSTFIEKTSQNTKIVMKNETKRLETFTIGLTMLHLNPTGGLSHSRAGS